MVKGDALLIVKQILGIWACENEKLRKKVQAIRRLFNQFEEVQLYHIPRKQNEVADLLAQKAVACDESEVQVILATAAIKQPRYQGMEALAPIVSYILEGEFPQGFTKAQKWRLMEEASSLLFLEGAIYQRGKDQVCRRIPTMEEIPFILEGLHEEACGGHFAQELTTKQILLAGKGLLTEVCDEFHILHRHSTPYYPQSNALVEKANGIIAGIIHKMVKNKTELRDDFLDRGLWAYQTTYKEARELTPFHLVYGQEALQPIKLNIPTIRLHGKVAQGEEEAWAGCLLNLAELEWKREAAYECYKRRATQVKDKLNKKVKDKGIKEGDLVLRYDNRFDNRFDVKFNTRWQGPYIMKKAFNSSYYELMDLDGKEHCKKVDGYRLKPYLSRILPKDLQEYQSATLPSSNAYGAPVNCFKGRGFHTWQTRIKLMLMKKALWSITNGKERKPQDATAATTWEERDNKAQAIIKLELDDTYIHHVHGCETAKETWDQLDTLFGAQAKSSKFGLLIEFFKLEMSAKTPLASHLNNMQSLMTQLAGISLKVDEDIAIVVLLKSPPSSYDHIVTTLTNMHISKLVDVQASLLEEEKKRNGKVEIKEASIQSDEKVFFNKNLKPKAKGKVVCDFCHKSGHEEKDCFSKKKTKKAYFSFKLDEEDDEEEYKWATKTGG
ncbi:hypothetical protein L7F22_035611 [Adiantum nelumboides]|nr:hypothetical protein [Adiantum nelumboides]